MSHSAAHDLRPTIAALRFKPGELMQFAAILDGPPSAATFMVEDLDAAAAWTARHAEQGKNVYLCLNPLKTKLGKKAGAEDVAVTRVLLVDVDPRKTPDDPDGIDRAKQEACATLAREIAASLERDAGARPVLVDSGRGHQLWIHHAEDIGQDERKALSDGLQAKFAHDAVKFDATHNADRLARLPGFKNTKTGRKSMLVDAGSGSPLTRDGITHLGLPAPAQTKAVTVAPPTEVRGRALEIWNAPLPRPNRSKDDSVFLLELRRIGVSEKRAQGITLTLPGGKANEDQRTDESYWTSTLNWVRKEYSLDEAAELRVASLNKETAFDAESIAALARIHALNRNRCLDALRQLKDAGVDVAELKRDVRRRIKEDLERAAEEALDVDAVARHAISDGKGAGWWIRTQNAWMAYRFAEALVIFRSRDLPVEAVVCRAQEQPWTLVAEPFQPEELSGRRWNKDAAKLAYAPKPGEHPTWDQVLRVCGRSLNALIAGNGFLTEHAIESGAEYLRAWIASVVQRPRTKLPWLFLHGPENVGKSTFHELLGQILLARGYVIANEALSSERGFNKEIAGAVVCVVEEIELKRSALRRIKLWTTGEKILIHEKGATAYQLDNVSHWIQTGNKAGDCPMLAGDTRVTAIRVDAPELKDQLSKDEILRRCREEAPAFVATILALKLPPVVGRLGLPVIESAEKKAQQVANRSTLDVWCDAHPAWIEMTDADLVRAFTTSLEGIEAGKWDTARTFRELTQVDGWKRRAVLLALRSFVSADREWSGRVSDLTSARRGSAQLAALGITVNELGDILAKPMPGFDIEKRRPGGKRIVVIRRVPTVPTMPTPSPTPKEEVSGGGQRSTSRASRNGVGTASRSAQSAHPLGPSTNGRPA